MNINLDNSTHRHALYIRDRHECLWCGCRVVPGAPMHCSDAATLDHITPRAHGGDDTTSNLAVACAECNSRRQDTVVGAWIRAEGLDASRVRRELANRRRRVLDLEAGARQAERVAAALVEAAAMTRALLIARVL